MPFEGDLPHYPSVFLDRDWPKHPQLYKVPPLPWRSQLKRDEVNNRYIVDASNCRICLTECPDLAGLIWFETMHKRCFVCGRMPLDDVFSPDQRRWMTHDDVTHIQIFIQREALPGIDRRTVYFAIRHTAQLYHKFRLENFTEDRT